MPSGSIWSAGKCLATSAGQVRRQPVVLLPFEIMRGIGRVGDVDGLDAAALLLRDALKNPLRAGALDAHGDPGIFRLEGPRQALGGVEFKRRIKRQLALLLRGFDQGRRHLRRRRRRGLHRFGKQKTCGGNRRRLEQVTSRPFAVPHRILPCDTTVLRGRLTNSPMLQFVARMSAAISGATPQHRPGCRCAHPGYK